MGPRVGIVFALWALCCPVARATDEIPVGGMLLWLRADWLGELDETGGVRVWENQAPGATGHAVQGESSGRPQWIGSVQSLGRQPALEFDGKDDFLHLPWLRIGSQTTVILVAENTKQTEGASYWRALVSGDDDSFRDGATKYAFCFRRAGYDPRFIANLYYAPEKPHRLMEPASGATSAGFHIYGFRRQGESTEGMTLRVDGATVASLTADKNPADFPGVGYTIGQGGDATAGRLFRFYRGRIAEILVYDRPLAAIEMFRVEEYLAEKYDLTREYAPPTRGLVLWLDANLLPTGDADDTISRLEDQSGQGHDAIQPDPNLRPGYRPRGINRRPALDFSRRKTQFDFSGWHPPAGGEAYAALRSSPRDGAEVVRECPAIAADWSSGDGPFRGLLSELLVYQRKLSKDEAESVEHYLQYRYSESPDPRCFDNGTLIFHNGYNDQPYVVKCHDGSWLCVITTSKYEERGADRTLVVTRSRDRGRTWSTPAYSIEPPEMRQPSWGTLYVAPYGRVYIFYNLREKKAGPSPIGFFFKYSDDHGETWTAKRYPIPIRRIALDRQFPGTGGWSVCPPVEVGTNVLVSYTRFGVSKRSRGQGFVFRSDNLQTEREARKIRWEMLPAGDFGIRAEEVKSDMQEEHILTPLSGDDLFCLWRTTSGYACHGYSRDGGRTWTDRGFATYQPGGRRIKQPLACCRPYRTSDGRYLLWFHNTKPQSETAAHRPRDVVWLAGGEQRDGLIHWSQPEVLLYGFDLPVRGQGMSYPDFIEQDGRLWVTTTDKENARIFEIDPAMLEGLWNQDKRSDVPTEGLMLDLEKKASRQAYVLALPSLPSLLHGGFTVDLMFRLDDLRPGQTLLDCRSLKGKGWCVTTADRGTLRIELDDGRHAPEGWATDRGLLEPDRTHHVTFIVDGGANLILVVVDGVLCDGGDEAQRGWGRFSRRLADVSGESSTLRVAGELHENIQRLRLYRRPLPVSEAVRIHRHGHAAAAVN